MKTLLLTLLFIGVSVTNAATFGNNNIESTQTVCRYDTGFPFLSQYIRWGFRDQADTNIVINRLHVYVSKSGDTSSPITIYVTINDYDQETAIGGSEYTYPQVVGGSVSGILTSQLPAWITIPITQTTLVSGKNYIINAKCVINGSGSLPYLYVHRTNTVVTDDDFRGGPTFGPLNDDPYQAFKNAGYYSYSMYADYQMHGIKVKHRLLKLVHGLLKLQ